MTENELITEIRAKKAEKRAEYAEYALAVRKAGWLPISTAPKDDTEILLVCVMGTMAVAYWSEKLGFWTWGLGKEFRRPTHWMPLPNAPLVHNAEHNRRE